MFLVEFKLEVNIQIKVCGQNYFCKCEELKYNYLILRADIYLLIYLYIYYYHKTKYLFDLFSMLPVFGNAILIFVLWKI